MCRSSNCLDPPVSPLLVFRVLGEFNQSQHRLGSALSVRHPSGSLCVRVVCPCGYCTFLIFHLKSLSKGCSSFVREEPLRCGDSRIFLAQTSQIPDIDNACDVSTVTTSNVLRSIRHTVHNRMFARVSKLTRNHGPPVEIRNMGTLYSRDI